MIKLSMRMFILFSFSIHASEVIDLYFTPKEPYYYTNLKGRHTGFLLESVKQKMEANNFKVVTQEIPSKRILTELLEKRKNVCSIGWFKTPERIEKYLFSNRIYNDKSLVYVSTKQVNDNSFKNFLINNQIKIELAIGYSYSAQVDLLVEKYITKFSRDVQNTEGAIRMLANGRVDGTLMSQEEFDHFSIKEEFKKIQFHSKKFIEFPEGNSRYIICTKETSPQVMEKINFAIK